MDRHNVVRREKLRALFGQVIESLDIGILVLDRSGRLMLVNESGRKLLPGISSATPDVDFRELLRDHPKVLEMAASALQSGNYAKEVEYSIDSTGDGMIVVFIEDTGEGIPPDKLERLFDPFFSGRPHGTGLGLTIAQKLIDAHWGRMEVESEVGRGTRVTVELPPASSGWKESSLL